MLAAAPRPLPAATALAGSTTPSAAPAAARTVVTPGAVTAAVAKVAASGPAIAIAAPSVLAGANQTVAFSQLFTIGSAASNPAYLIVTGLDRDEYTVGNSASGMGHLTGGTASQGFTDVSGDAWSDSVVFTYQASTGQYVNASFGTLGQLAVQTGSNSGDTATFSVFGTGNAALAKAYAANPFVLAANPAYFQDYGSVAVVTGAASQATRPATATPGGIACRGAELRRRRLERRGLLGARLRHRGPGRVRRCR